MTMNQKIIDNIMEEGRILAEISEQLTVIDCGLAPIRQLQKLCNESEICVATFENLEPAQIVEMAVTLATDLQFVRNSLKDIHRRYDDLSDGFYCPAKPCLATEIKELKSKIDNIVVPETRLVSEVSNLKSTVENIVTTQPKPLDYSKLDFTTPIAEAVAKTKPLPSVPSEKQLKQSNEEKLRSNNLIIYNVSYDKENPVMALEYAKDYFNSCGVTSYYLEQQKIVDAQFLSVSEDNGTCNLRVVMNNPWVVRTLLSDARKLKSSDSKLFRGLDFDFSKTYISRDMTRAERDKHRQLIIELKNKITEDPTTRWIIKFGRVQAGGDFIKS